MLKSSKKRMNVLGRSLLALLVLGLAAASTALAGDWCGIGVYEEIESGRRLFLQYNDQDAHNPLYARLIRHNLWDYPKDKEIRTYVDHGILKHGYVVVVWFKDDDGERHLALGEASQKKGGFVQAVIDATQRLDAFGARPLESYVTSLNVYWVRSGITTQVTGADIESLRQHYGGYRFLATNAQGSKFTIKELSGSTEIFLIHVRGID